MLLAKSWSWASAARTYARERLDVCRKLDDPALTASAFIGAGLAAALEGDHRLARPPRVGSLARGRGRRLEAHSATRYGRRASERLSELTEARFSWKQV